MFLWKGEDGAPFLIGGFSVVDLCEGVGGERSAFFVHVQ